MAESKMPFKPNFGATNADIARGFTEGMDQNEEGYQEDDLMLEDALEEPETDGGFLGRSKGWER